MFFLLVGAAVKPLFQESLMQWLFSMFTVMSLYAVTVVVSYFLCDFFPAPYYANTVLRAILFAAAIALFRSRLRLLCRQAAEHWSIYLSVAAGLFVNFEWYFVSGDDVERTLTESVAPLTLRFTAVDTGQPLLELANPYGGAVELDAAGLPVAAEDGHGRGTQSVAAFVKRCGGELDYQVSGGVFRVQLLV